MKGQTHIGPKGPGKCNAKTPGGCPFGGSNEHFDDPEEANEFVYGHMQPEITKNGAPKPEVDIDSASFKMFRLEEGAVPEKKNKGEYAEGYVLDSLVSNRKLVFGAGTKPFRPMAVRARNHIYVTDPNDEDMIAVQTPNGEIYSVSRQDDEDLDYTRDQIQKGGRGETAFASPAMQSRMVALGFTNGRIPKSPSESKSDVSVWDEEGVEHRISIKSYMGSDPALASASKASEMTYSSKLPEGMSEDEAQSHVGATEGMSTQERVRYLKSKGIQFDPESGQPSHEQFQASLTQLDESGRSQKAYSRGLFSVADSRTEMTPELQGEYNKTLGAFSRRMRYTGFEPKGREVTDHLAVTQTGAMKVNRFESDEEAGEYYSRRAKFSEPAKSKFPSGDVRIENGRAVLRLNSNIAIAEVPRG